MYRSFFLQGQKYFLRGTNLESQIQIDKILKDLDCKSFSVLNQTNNWCTFKTDTDEIINFSQETQCLAGRDLPFNKFIFIKK